MHETLEHTTVNGIDVAALRGCIVDIQSDSARGQTSWAVTSTWKGGTRSDHAVRGFGFGGRYIERPFTISVDEPHELCGTNEFANPQEYLMSALNACMMVGYSAVAALMGITLTKLEIDLRGDIDLRGFLGIDAKVKPGYGNLQQTVRIAGDATEEQFRQLHEIIKATSPNFFNITTAIPTGSRLVIER
ncbi:MAG: OsmC family protein [Phycisphaeraceae bacterium]|nr:OsmC family protein [Phycisphaeraceae bacterium]MCW5754225.1 OsmC family protein [Phycisphaeraceae bacterium]